nr:MAG TPA: hypothetical protein [Caudoviricetes sp.]
MSASIVYIFAACSLPPPSKKLLQKKFKKFCENPLTISPRGDRM